MAENIQPGEIQDQEEVKVQAGRARAALPAADLPDKVHTWPYLVRAEFIAGCVLLLVLMVWSITVDAPMEEPANPTKTPNPSKAPWYFLGLQELLVYFDPWIAGVLLPGLIIVGLMAIPFIDPSPKGVGVYDWKGRAFANTMFTLGLTMWFVFIAIGYYCRGPNFFWYLPWESGPLAGLLRLSRFLLRLPHAAAPHPHARLGALPGDHVLGGLDGGSAAQDGCPPGLQHQIRADPALDQHEHLR